MNWLNKRDNTFIICPECTHFEHCRLMGYADATSCKNFEKPLFQTKKELYRNLKSYNK